MTPRRVLYLCPNSRRAGAEQVTALCIRHHDRSRWDPRILFFSDGPLVDEMRAEGARCYLPPPGRKRPRLRDPLSFLSEVREIRRLIISERIELVHSVMGYAHLYGGLAARLAGVPELWFQHGPPGTLDWLTGRVPTRTILVNSCHTELAQARYRAATRKVRRIPLGVEPIESGPWKEQARELRGRFAPDAVIFALVGRVTRAKGPLLFAEAAARVIESLPNGAKAGFLLVGAPFMEGDEIFLAELRRRIGQKGLERHIHFTGHLSPPTPALCACDVLVNCSLAPEPFGLTLVEAMMLAKPVLAPRAGGPIEIVREPETGLLFEPGSADSLAQAMLRLIGAGARERETMGERGRERALELFHVKRMVREIEEEYDAILGR